MPTKSDPLKPRVVMIKKVHGKPYKTIVIQKKPGPRKKSW